MTGTNAATATSKTWGWSLSQLYYPNFNKGSYTTACRAGQTLIVSLFNSFLPIGPFMALFATVPPWNCNYSNSAHWITCVAFNRRGMIICKLIDAEFHIHVMLKLSWLRVVMKQNIGSIDIAPNKWYFSVFFDLKIFIRRGLYMLYQLMSMPLLSHISNSKAGICLILWIQLMRQHWCCTWGGDGGGEGWHQTEILFWIYLL